MGCGEKVVMVEVAIDEGERRMRCWHWEMGREAGENRVEWVSEG